MSTHPGVDRARQPAPRRRLIVALGSLCAEGTPVLTLDLCREWRKLGIEPSVVTLAESPTDLASEFASAGVPVWSMQLPSKGRRRYLRMVRSMHAICRERQAQALLSMPLGWHSFLALGARLAGVPTVLAHVGNYPSHTATPAFEKFRWLVQAGRPITTKLICCSSYVQHGVVSSFGVPESATRVIYNGIDVGAIRERAAAARKERDEHAGFVVGMVARFEVHKDQPTLIKAAKLLNDRDHPIRVWLIGDGSRRAEYERLIRELQLDGQVVILGVRRDIPELLARLDAFVFAATPDEGQGVALVEAMASGVPIVATDVGACREVLEGGALGALVPAADPRALADAIDELRRNTELGLQRAAKALQKAVQDFSIEDMARAYARCLRLDV